MRFDCVFGLVPVPLRPYRDRPSDFQITFRDEEQGWDIYGKLRRILKRDQITQKYDANSGLFTIVFYGENLPESEIYEKLKMVPEVKLIW